MESEKKSFKQKMRDRKSAKHYAHQAYIDTLDYDEENQRFTLDRVTAKQSDVKPSDKLVTNDTYHYFNTELEPPEFQRTSEDGKYVYCTPIDDYQYTQNTDIIESLLALIKPRMDQNKLILGVLGGLGVAVLGFIILRIVGVV